MKFSTSDIVDSLRVLYPLITRLELEEKPGSFPPCMIDYQKGLCSPDGSHLFLSNRRALDRKASTVMTRIEEPLCKAAFALVNSIPEVAVSVLANPKLLARCWERVEEVKRGVSQLLGFILEDKKASIYELLEASNLNHLPVFHLVLRTAYSFNDLESLIELTVSQYGSPVSLKYDFPMAAILSLKNLDALYDRAIKILEVE